MDWQAFWIFLVTLWGIVGGLIALLEAFWAVGRFGGPVTLTAAFLAASLIGATIVGLT